MKFIIPTIISLIIIAVNSSRSKRSLMNLNQVLKEVTGHNGFYYNCYGNYCGKGSNGEPVDAIDKCCQTHDVCYYRINRAECKAELRTGPYIIDYDWSVSAPGEIICDNQDGVLQECKKASCECDRIVATCLKGNETTYNPENKRNLLNCAVDTFQM